MTQRSDLEHIIEWVPNESRVLDLGCGEGELLEALINAKQVSGVGVDIDINIQICIDLKILFRFTASKYTKCQDDTTQNQ